MRGPLCDPRLSVNGNRLARRLQLLLDGLCGLENWLQYPGMYELKRNDRVQLTPQWARLIEAARNVADRVEDMLQLVGYDAAEFNERRIQTG